MNILREQKAVDMDGLQSEYRYMARRHGEGVSRDGKTNFLVIRNCWLEGWLVSLVFG